MWTILIKNNQYQLMSSVGILTRQEFCDDVAVLMRGIGGVKTRLNHRRKGYAGTGIQKALKFLTEICRVDFSLLVCRDDLIPYYCRLGWQLFEGQLLVRQSTRKITFTLNNTMLIDGVNPIPACKFIDSCGKPL